MQYVMLIYPNWGPLVEGTLSEDERASIAAEYAELLKIDGLTAGLPLGLPSNATTVRVNDGKAELTAGPLSANGETVGGSAVYEADNLDAALELASRIPAARLGGAVEVRPVGQYW
jgi:hypothetical protein